MELNADINFGDNDDDDDDADLDDVTVVLTKFIIIINTIDNLNK